MVDGHGVENGEAGEGSVGDVARRVLPLIDLTLLGDADQVEDVDALCAAALTPHGPVAAVCVWPEFVGHAVERLDGAIPVAGVANFPEGRNEPDRAVTDSRQVVDAGGSEVDVVFPWRSLVAGDADVGRALVAATRDAIGDDVVLKVILETGEIGDEWIAAAAAEAIAGGADFLKTSTGKSPTGATLDAARILLETVAASERSVGVKISGGVRTVAQAADYLALADEICGRDWVSSSTFRIGASSLLDDVLDTLEGS